MQRHYKKEISSHDAYFHALFGLLIALSSTIRCTRYYFCLGLIPRRIHSYFDNLIISYGAYLHALFVLLIAMGST